MQYFDGNMAFPATFFFRSKINILIGIPVLYPWKGSIDNSRPWAIQNCPRAKALGQFRIALGLEFFNAALPGV